MIILGLNYGHHGSACVIKDGKIISALSSERLSRAKFSHGVTEQLLDVVLESAGINIHHVDYIAISDWNKEYAFHPIKVWLEDKEIECLWNRVYDNTCLNSESEIRGRMIPTFHIGHQLAHAAAAYYTSPFEDAFCFTMDASGANHKNNSLVSKGKGTKLVSMYCPGLMAGVAYGYFTEFLGLGSQMFKAGSTMALAGYGKILQQVVENPAKYINGCFFGLKVEYRHMYGDLWRDLNGSDNRYISGEWDAQKPKDIAATIQYIFEEAILQCVKGIQSGETKNLCLGGGSMLNCNANTRLLFESQFDRIHLFPGCGDDGLCVGAVFYVNHNIMGEKRYYHTDGEICYTGPERPSAEPDYNYLASELANGKIIAWHNGRSEYGPRALGNRSMLADPRTMRSRERVNFEIKNREAFRPLAPAVLEEHTQEWFDFPEKSPFMLYTMQVKQPDLIPAVVHVDNSARIQTVNEVDNPQFYKLIKAFYEITGVPILLNTSLNENGYPMLETDEHAMEFYEKGIVDILVLNGQIIQKGEEL